MEILILIAVVSGIVALVRSLGSKSPPVTSTPRRPPPPSSTVRTKPDPNVFRPSSQSRGSRTSAIQFKENAPAAGSPTDLDIKDLVDALTGAPLRLDAGLFQCNRCKVFYQIQSAEVIRTENGGRCVSCLHTELVSVTGRRGQRGRNADVNIISLENYRQYVGHVITFESRVCTVKCSRRGTDYAVMFENKNWKQGFKMVAFRGAVDRIGGERFVYSLANRTVRVRGLLVLHKVFGYQIIVTDRAMILSIQ